MVINNSYLDLKRNICPTDVLYLSWIINSKLLLIRTGGWGDWAYIVQGLWGWGICLEFYITSHCQVPVGGQGHRTQWVLAHNSIPCAMSCSFSRDLMRRFGQPKLFYSMELNNITQEITLHWTSVKGTRHFSSGPLATLLMIHIKVSLVVKGDPLLPFVSMEKMFVSNPTNIFVIA